MADVPATPAPATTPKPLIEGQPWANMANVKLAITYGIFFGIGVVAGWYLTTTGFLM
jgi:hypothetical protein